MVEDELTSRDLKSLAKLGKILRYSSGDTVFLRGDFGYTVYVILEGGVEINLETGPIRLVVGSLFGEMALFNENIRTATVRVVEACELIEITSEQLQALIVEQNKVSLKLMYMIGKLMIDRAEKFKNVNFKKALIHSWSLEYHALGYPGKIAIMSTKNIGSYKDLAVAYSPGVASPCISIHKNPSEAYSMTSKGNLVGVITNGSAVLGLGNIGPLAAKPVMEGKAVLFKLFSGVDAFDIEINEDDPLKFIDTVKRLEPTFGGINLEDIKAPECFYIEETLIKKMNIPVFHDDQHGTAIIVAAGLLNALEIVNKDIGKIKIVSCGVGAAGYTCAKYLLSLGVKAENIFPFDVEGFVTRKKAAGTYLEDIALHQAGGSLEKELVDADVFIGLSRGGVLKPDMLLSMNKNPIVFALANPAPEIDYHTAKKTRNDVIIATGRSDFPNQINNVMVFPYLFRGALDIQASLINYDMKLAATKALSRLAKAGADFGPDKIIPNPFSEELIINIPLAVAEAGMATKVSRKTIELESYKKRLRYIKKQYKL